MFTFRLSADEASGRTVGRMRENFPDPYLAQTAFDADAATAEDLDDEEFDLEFGEGGDELDIEEDRARER